ncbi:VWA domain-containing protein [Pyrinomonas methylaliphatogenes]|jgi:Ca-activated chloride channel family protein|uniref:von Willebrand factor type A domain n=1 Tax=Pyrinomonas methylaliphatogenes TaxID=454194 RepID=A0A0B6WZ02_9BACT|nr:VWA domain-containing protein [Pyrinomonas methylaliphatogenes]CDM66336.1 von Willebrand factor type A domain [Pyrinomonas methylaliphatogenes]
MNRARAQKAVLIALLLFAAPCGEALTQAGRRTSASSNERTIALNVTATRTDASSAPISADEISLFDDGIEQTIKSFSPDPTPARIVLLLDNSATLRTDIEKLGQAVREFIYEIYEGDQIMVVGYDERPEILADWTDAPAKIEEGIKLLRKRGEPHLFDAIAAVVDQALLPLTGIRKRAIVLISDGLDRGSKSRFNQILAELQREDITVYALQLPDRTGGAYRRDQPKPAEAIRLLTEGTGGRAFPFGEFKETAATICDELRRNRYVLAYSPTGVSYNSTRRLLLVAHEGINVRAKTMQP